MYKSYERGASAAIHETAFELSEAGLISHQTMRKFDELSLTPVHPLSAEEIKGIRLKAQVSQSVFARYLNVSPGIVSQWERGEKHPAGASLKLLAIVKKKGLEAIS